MNVLLQFVVQCTRRLVFLTGPSLFYRVRGTQIRLPRVTTRTTTRFRECECRTSAEKKRSLTRDTSPVHSRISRTKVDLLRDLFPGFSPWPVSIYNLKTLVRAQLSFLRQKGRREAPSHSTLLEKVLREKPHISRPANLKILKSTFPAARVMAPDDC